MSYEPMLTPTPNKDIGMVAAELQSAVDGMQGQVSKDLMWHALQLIRRLSARVDMLENALEDMDPDYAGEEDEEE